MQYRICPDCGAHLDPGEVCDCTTQGIKKELPPASDSSSVPIREQEPMDILYPDEQYLSTPDQPQPSYYSIIPAPVRYSPGLPPNAKLLYGEISSLCGQEGFCFASNKYFAGLYGVSVKAVSRWLTALTDMGFISIIAPRDGRTERRIYLGVSTDGGQDNGQNCPGRTKMSGEVDKNVQPHNIYNNINNIYTQTSTERKQRSFAPREQFGCWVQTVSEHWLQDDVVRLLAAFDGFADTRKRMGKPIRSPRTVTLLCNRLSEYACGSPADMIAMLDAAVVHGWLSVYPLKDSAAPRPTEKKRKDDVEWL